MGLTFGRSELFNHTLRCQTVLLVKTVFQAPQAPDRVTAGEAERLGQLQPQQRVPVRRREVGEQRLRLPLDPGAQGFCWLSCAVTCVERSLSAMEGRLPSMDGRGAPLSTSSS